VILLIVTFRFNINTFSNINNIDNKFATEMCYDMQTEKQSITTSIASVNTRDMTVPMEHHNKYPTIDFSEEYRIDAKPFVNRPFFVESVPWNTEPALTYLTYNIRRLPGDIFTSNPSLEAALKLGAYFRSDLSLSISLAGTIGHAGTLIAGILPPFPGDLIDGPSIINSILSGPHCFLSANEATSCVLHVPWYCNTDVASLDINPTPPVTRQAVCEGLKPGDFGTLVLFVLNPLTFSDGSSSSLNVTIEACFSSLDIFVPCPKYITFVTQGLKDSFKTQGLQSIASAAIDATTSYSKKMVGDAIDVLRQGIKYYTGLHNPNIPLINNRMITTRRNYPNNTTGEQFFEKLDPYPEIDRIVDRPIFNTDVDEMSIKHILSKPQYLGTFNVREINQVGNLKWARPISPFQGGLNGRNQSVYSANNLELFHSISRAWRGSLKIHIQSVMNNKQQIKLRVVQLYNPPFSASSGYPRYSDILSAPSHLIEFTAGGQIQSIELPYLCRNQLTPCAPDRSTEAFFHGMYYIYVAQPLVFSNDSPTSISFNIYMSGGEDLTFHGYATEPFVQSPYVLPRENTFDDIFSALVVSQKQKIQSLESKMDYFTQGLTVMNEPQKDATLESYSTSINTDTAHQERLYSPIDIRPIIRRMYQADGLTLANGPNVIDLNKLIGERLNELYCYIPQLVAGMYYGKNVGLKVKIKVFNSVNDSDLIVMFAPPQVNIDSNLNQFRRSIVNPTGDLGPYDVTGSYPFPLIEMSQYVSGPTRLYEFVIPNTSIYKFIGGPQKFTYSTDTLSIADFGSLILWNDAPPCNITTFFGFTDETRFGFHCMAPIFRPYTLNGVSASAYKGSTEDGENAPPRLTLNPYLYFTE
jgi:hypothetical protein